MHTVPPWASNDTLLLILLWYYSTLMVGMRRSSRPSSSLRNAKKTRVIAGAHTSWSAAVLARTAGLLVGASGYTCLCSTVLV